ncbi:NAD(P)/FAD-dependent oxidoreductase [Thioalkalivibrio paradoxus]|uniref:FAD-dependent pyridine nucleotide-disulfide oxidoreductase n=1 Tax=Thioalkalivibrio paradoxus ARh 1 TaxID=713585 RepID=W0DNX7_9GAMM|nr:FAD-dependent oxidoreductase [Thioalkalivibrio paradoxus]AHE98678.1 FAD-dependent pyridine nucleotide-disulfide oxidoreductase [Thioalkalivibrio paradoxus ARh 1]
MTRITVIGAGFGALTAVRKLRAADRDLTIDVIAPKPELVYYPSTIWIPTGLRRPEDVVVDLNPFFRRMGVNYHQASATGLRDGGRVVITDAGEVPNDGLVIASGGRFLKKLPGIEHSITPCEGVPAAVAIRDRIAAMQGGTIAFGFAGNPKEPSAMRGGPVFEFMFGIDQHLRKRGDRDRFKLVFFTPAPKPGNRLGPKAVEGLLKEMKRRDIETHLGHKLKAFEADKVITEGGEFGADLIVFMPGMTGNAWFDDTELPRSEGGLLQANEFCQVVGQDKVYVAGDSGSFPGPDWLPKQAHMADLQAEAAVANLLGEFAGKAPSQTYKTELICIVDTRSSGILVKRTEKRSVILPATPMFHWAKRAFEWWYLRQYR